MPSLVRVDVEGLLGQFHHDIDFPASWDFVILYGPNGVGKTKILELIKAVAAIDLFTLHQIPFDRATLYFEGRIELWIVRVGQLPLPEIMPDSAPVAQYAFEFSLHEPDSAPVTWTPSSGATDSRQVAQWIDRHSALTQVGPRQWRNPRNGRRMSQEETLEFLGASGVYFPNLDDPAPAQLAEFLEDFSVHLIETQRLLTMADVDPRSTRESARASTVEEYSRDVVDKLSMALAQNSRKSQELDRSFPSRLLRAGELPPTVTDENIRSRYEEQNELRAQLARISVLDPTPPLPLPTEALESWQRRVLWTYLDDSEQKLSTFQSLLEKVTLLREIVNSRFIYKELTIDPKNGFRFVMQDGSEISPRRLSSGEQHELVLTYELLFKVRSGSVVFIDEPEISLHIGWQQSFLNDVAKIAELSNFRFVVATHSPQIIHKWWERARALGPEIDPRGMEI
ncbi:AAA family ATPase [Kribbella sp. NPDC023972]|uniref:AAA family ATPase n=1 Tax=Kribbella sp. NPDC023972 TaxID=3154795 RepID=UPI0033C3AEEE